MIVKERLNFERGQNPMDSMDIGRVLERRFLKFKEECMELLGSYDDQLNPNKKTVHIVNEDNWYLKAGFNYRKFFGYFTA